MTDPESTKKSASPVRRYTGVGLAIGAGVGAAIGTATDNIAVGVSLGVALGLVFGSGLDRRLQQQRDDQSAQTKPASGGPGGRPPGRCPRHRRESRPGAVQSHRPGRGIVDRARRTARAPRRRSPRPVLCPRSGYPFRSLRPISIPSAVSRFEFCLPSSHLLDPTKQNVRDAKGANCEGLHIGPRADRKVSPDSEKLGKGSIKSFKTTT